MPRVVEIKEIDGEPWIRFPKEVLSDTTGMLFFTVEEMKSHDFGIRLLLLHELEEWLKEQRKSAYD